jgi:hypothetical protein
VGRHSRAELGVTGSPMALLQPLQIILFLKYFYFLYSKKCLLSTCIPKFIAALFIIVKLWKQTRCPTTDIDPHMMEYYSVIKKNEIMSFAGKWMQLENIMLSNVSQVQKDKGRMFSLICGS